MMTRILVMQKVTSAHYGYYFKVIKHEIGIEQ